MNIQQYKLSLNSIDKLQNICKTDFGIYFLLNSKNACSNILEYFVSEIAKYHLHPLGLGLDDTFVEFFIQNGCKRVQLETQYDKVYNREHNRYKYPIVSTITFLNDNPVPMLFTNFKLNDIKYKCYPECTSLRLIIPQTMMHIRFEPHLYSGPFDFYDKHSTNTMNTIHINIWACEPLQRTMYNPAIESFQTNIQFESIQPVPAKITHREKESVKYDTFDSIFFGLNQPIIHNIEFKNDVEINLLFYRETFCKNMCNTIINAMSNKNVSDIEHLGLDKVVTDNIINFSISHIEENNRSCEIHFEKIIVCKKNEIIETKIDVIIVDLETGRILNNKKHENGLYELRIFYSKVTKQED